MLDKEELRRDRKKTGKDSVKNPVFCFQLFVVTFVLFRFFCVLLFVLVSFRFVLFFICLFRFVLGLFVLFFMFCFVLFFVYLFCFVYESVMFSGNGFRSFCLSLLLVYCHLPSSRYSLCLCHFRLSFSSYLIHILFIILFLFLFYLSCFHCHFPIVGIYSCLCHGYLSWLSFSPFILVALSFCHSYFSSIFHFSWLRHLFYHHHLSIFVIIYFCLQFSSHFHIRLFPFYISLSHLLSSQKYYLHLAWLFGNLGNREWECAGNRTAAPATGLRAARILEAKWRSCREEGLRGEGERV